MTVKDTLILELQRGIQTAKQERAADDDFVIHLIFDVQRAKKLLRELEG